MSLRRFLLVDTFWVPCYNHCTVPHNNAACRGAGRTGTREGGGRGLNNRVRDLARAVGKLPRKKRVAVVVMVAFVVLTWLAVCLVLASLFAG